LNQVESLRLMAQRTQLMARLQAARRGLKRPPLAIRIIGAIGGGLFKLVQYAQRALR
jgi:hypothetical protein